MALLGHQWRWRTTHFAPVLPALDIQAEAAAPAAKEVDRQDVDALLLRVGLETREGLSPASSMLPVLIEAMR